MTTLSPSQAFADINVDFNASSSKSNQAKYKSTANLIQKYIDDLQTRLDLPSLKYEDITEIGGSPSTCDEDVTKWWFAFWEGQPSFWFSLKQTNGKPYAASTLERYMPNIKNQLQTKFMMSRYLPMIKETYKSAMVALKTKVKAGKNMPRKNKVYTNEDITFILQRCLWFNSEEYIDFFIFQTALLRLCSRAAETSRLTLQKLSIRELIEGSHNNILQCHVVRDKQSTDNNIPLIPNKSEVFGDLTVAFGLAVFIRDSDSLMPTIASLNGDSAAAAHYTKMLENIWRRYPPAAGVNVKKGTSHFGKYTTQYLLDGARLDKAAKLFGGWKVDEGARNTYHTNSFPYLLDGAKHLAGWSKVGSDYQRVSIPTYETISGALGDKICSAFFGHLPELSNQIKRMFLVCLMSKWDQLLQQIQAEPNGLFKNPHNHIIFSTLMKRLSEHNIELVEFNDFKTLCQEMVNKANTINFANTTVVQQPIVPSLPPVTCIKPTTVPNQDYSLSLFQQELENIHPLKALLDLTTRSTDPRVVLINFFALNFMNSYMSSPPVNNDMKCKYRKIKAAVRVMTRFLDVFPISKPSEEEANVALARIKTVLLSEAANVKTQSQKPFTKASPLSLTLIRRNEELLADKTKPWYRPLPKDTPYPYIEHFYGHKIYDTINL